jgi:hypothetical protein
MQSRSILGTAHHLSQLVLAGEVGPEDIEVVDQVTATGQNRLFGGDFAVGLDSEFEVGKERVRDLGQRGQHGCTGTCVSWCPTYSVGSEGDVAVLEQLVAEEVGKGVVFLVEGEDGRVGSA